MLELVWVEGYFWCRISLDFYLLHLSRLRTLFRVYYFQFGRLIFPIKSPIIISFSYVGSISSLLLSLSLAYTLTLCNFSFPVFRVSVIIYSLFKHISFMIPSYFSDGRNLTTAVALLYFPTPMYLNIQPGSLCLGSDNAQMSILCCLISQRITLSFEFQDMKFRHTIFITFFC